METNKNKNQPYMLHSEHSLSCWRKAPFKTIKSSSDLCSRLKFVLERMDGESWLPEGLQKKIRTGCFKIFERHIEGNLDPDSAKRIVENLSAAVTPFSDLTLSSNTLCQIRTLDLEMSECLHIQRLKTEEMINETHSQSRIA